jgi:hypothetical protein
VGLKSSIEEHCLVSKQQHQSGINWARRNYTGQEAVLVVGVKAATQESSEWGQKAATQIMHS